MIKPHSRAVGLASIRAGERHQVRGRREHLPGEEEGGVGLTCMGHTDRVSPFQPGQPFSAGKGQRQNWTPASASQDLEKRPQHCGAG